MEVFWHIHKRQLLKTLWKTYLYWAIYPIATILSTVFNIKITIIELFQIFTRYSMKNVYIHQIILVSRIKTRHFVHEILHQVRYLKYLSLMVYYLTFSRFQTRSDAFAADDFWKVFGKRRNCSWWAISSFPFSHISFNFYLMIKLSFVEIFHIFDNIFSKSSSAELSPVGKG